MSKKKPFTEADLEKFKDREENKNPVYMFSLTHTRLLVEVLNGDIDVHYLMRRELAHRGLDKNGIWAGFKEAKKLHGIK